MKRELFENVKVFPHTATAGIDRFGFLSAALGVLCSAATAIPTLTVKVQHCDTIDGTYTDVSDTGAVLTSMPITLAANGVYSVGIDLIGCKRFVKFVPTITGTATCTYAVALGDAAESPAD